MSFFNAAGGGACEKQGLIYSFEETWTWAFEETWMPGESLEGWCERMVVVLWGVLQRGPGS